MPIRLQWDLNDETLVRKIEDAYEDAQEIICV